jgi:hypothetical protein
LIAHGRYSPNVCLLWTGIKHPYRYFIANTSRGARYLSAA